MRATRVNWFDYFTRCAWRRKPRHEWNMSKAWCWRCGISFRHAQERGDEDRSVWDV